MKEFEKLYSLKDGLYKTETGRRIYTEIMYAAEVSRAHGDALFANVLDAINALGAQTETTEQKAVEIEKLLKPVAALSALKEIICTAHAHIDMNWQWGYDETTAITLETFRTTLDLMNEYPDFTFAQSQASCYRIVERHAPAMLEEIKARIKDGRWEVTATEWVEPDKNLPSGESQTRQCLYAKNYLTKLLDIKADALNLDFVPDTFGHNLNVPEILSACGVKYMYHCRGNDGDCVYNWRAPSGAEILVYREPEWYNTHCEWADYRDVLRFLPSFAKKYGLEKVLRVYGIGDHGGGVTRSELNMLNELSRYPLLPKIKYGTYREFFEHLDAKRRTFKTVGGELNCIFDGCYTSQTRIKKGNKYIERALYDAEVFNVMSSAFTKNTRHNKIGAAWEKALYNHFHDIIPGSGVTETREHAMGLYQESNAELYAVKTASFKSITDRLDTSRIAWDDASRLSQQEIGEGGGAGLNVGAGAVSVSRGGGDVRVFAVFNSLPFERDTVAELAVFDWHVDLSKIVVKDGFGAPLEYQLLDTTPAEYWLHKYVRVLAAVRVPAFGYTTVVLSVDNNKFSEYNLRPALRVQSPVKAVLENARLKARFDDADCSLRQITDKASSASQDFNTGVFGLSSEDASQGMTAWVVGRIMSRQNFDRNMILPPSRMLSGNLRNSFSYETAFNSSRLYVTVSLENDVIKYKVKCVWREEAEPGRSVPQLNFKLPLPWQNVRYLCDAPFGVIERKAAQTDIPANNFVCALGADNDGLMLVSKDKYGYRLDDNCVTLNLIRSTCDPDMYHEYGVHDIEFAIIPVRYKNNSSLVNKALEYLYDAQSVSVPQRAAVGNLPPTGGLFKVDGGAAVSALKESEDGSGKFILRCYEVDGKAGKITVTSARRITAAYLTDSNENIIKKIALKDGAIRYPVGANAVLTLAISVDRG